MPETPSPDTPSSAPAGATRRRPDIVTVEIDHGSTSARNQPADRAWLVRLRRANHTVIINTGLGQVAAQHLARQIDRLLHHEPAPRT